MPEEVGEGKLGQDFVLFSEVSGKPLKEWNQIYVF